jgi:hypothetical protein
MPNAPQQIRVDRQRLVHGLTHLREHVAWSVAEYTQDSATVGGRTGGAEWGSRAMPVRRNRSRAGLPPSDASRRGDARVEHVRFRILGVRSAALTRRRSNARSDCATLAPMTSCTENRRKPGRSSEPRVGGHRRRAQSHRHAQAIAAALQRTVEHVSTPNSRPTAIASLSSASNRRTELSGLIACGLYWPKLEIRDSAMPNRRPSARRQQRLEGRMARVWRATGAGCGCPVR